MRIYLSLLLITAVSVVSCNRDQKDNCEGDLSFTNATVSASSSVANGIIFHTEMVGANLCYGFSHFNIIKTGTNSFDIHAFGRIPCNGEICAQALYHASPSGRIDNVPAGTYTLRFLTDKAVFAAISVTIN